MNGELERIQEYLLDIKSKYSLRTIEVVTTAVNIVVDKKGTTVTAQDIIAEFPKIILNLHSYLWEPLLKSINVTTWKDLGKVIFLCIDLGFYIKSPNDNIKDFIKEDSNKSFMDTFKELEKKGFDWKWEVKNGS